MASSGAGIPASRTGTFRLESELSDWLVRDSVFPELKDRREQSIDIAGLRAVIDNRCSNHESKFVPEICGRIRPVAPGFLRLNVQGFGLTVIVQGVWFIVVGTAMTRPVGGASSSLASTP